MTFNEIKQKISSLNSAWHEFKSTNDRRLDELEQKGTSDPLLQQTLNNINNSIEQTQKKLDMIEVKNHRPNLNYSSKVSFENPEHKNAFNSFLRFGEIDRLRQIQTKNFKYDHLQNDGNKGGYLIRPPMAEYIDLYSQDNEPIFDLVGKDYSTNNSVNFVTNEDDYSAQWNKDGTDFGSGDTENEVTFAQISVQKSMLFCRIKVNANIINDSIIDLEKYIVDVAARAFAQARTKGVLFGGLDVLQGISNSDDAALTKENAKKLGLTEIESALTKKSSDTNAKKALKKHIEDYLSYKNNNIEGISKEFQNAFNGDASSEMLIEKIGADKAASDITYANMLNLYHKLDARYLKNASFTMSSATLAHIRGLKDTNTGRYVWEPATANFTKDTVFGVPVYRVDTMDQIANQSSDGNYKKVYVYFGDFKRAYYLTLNPNVEIVRDPFSAQPSVNFLISQYTGGSMIDKKAIAALGNGS